MKKKPKKYKILKTQKKINKKNIMENINNKNLGIVGFSYEVTSKNSQSPWITERKWGRESSHKAEIAHGYNWSGRYHQGYGHSFIHLADKEPFYSIIGGYTHYTSNDSRSPNIKSDEWGIQSKDKFCIREGYSWNRFLNQEGYSRTYLYLLEREEIGNIFGSRIQSTSKDSKKNE